ncbi:hypothetical protein [Alkalibacterium sp. 20]|uniref:hypothetical protein n=1 Tax=Alkalibacterium sp. 20 TaxID=1798803 RepID=UPI0009001C83|nr:hypothetical protein [Alkalibacterium sp. 20]OJF91693.1 hypothetical protein AX762_10945 [Alkalibacterium sp. 20]
MTKIIQKVTIILSLLILIATALAPASHAARLDNHLDEDTFVLDVYDEELNDTIKIYLLYADNGKSRVQGINSENEIIYDYSFDVNDQSMTSELTGEVVDIDVPEVNLLSNTSTQSNYCNGSSYQNISYTVRQVASGIAGTATLAAVTAKLVGLISASKGFRVATRALKMAAGTVLSAILNGNFSKRVYLRIDFSCSRMWASDPFHPSGGFYFYGWRYLSTTYRGVW